MSEEERAELEAPLVRRIGNLKIIATAATGLLAGGAMAGMYIKGFIDNDARQDLRIEKIEKQIESIVNLGPKIDKIAKRLGVVPD